MNAPALASRPITQNAKVATHGSAPTDLGFVTLVERMFGIWGYVTAWLLWRGHIRAAAQA